MNTDVVPENANAFTAAVGTRWNEACKFVRTVMQFAGAARGQQGGVELHFLNRAGPQQRVRTVAEAAQYFQSPPAPRCGTPLITAMNKIFKARENSGPYLLVVVTDGEPTDYESDNIAIMKNTLMTKPRNVHVSMVECTSEKETMDYLGLCLAHLRICCDPRV
jgi:hypothetical protein